MARPEVGTEVVSALDQDRAFSGSIPQLYEKLLVPMIFEPYAADLASRITQLRPARVLELAAGTGVVTRWLAATLPPEVAIIATDLNQPMLDLAAASIPGARVEWRQADAMQLPFAEGSFDLVVCQFGVMFFPDKAKSFAEVRRVLRDGGHYLFSVWDRIEQNEFADVATGALGKIFPAAPPRFMARVPHGYNDAAVIAHDMANGGFTATPSFTTLAARSRTDSAQNAAIAYCQGTPLRPEIEAQGPRAMDAALAAATAALAARFGTGPIEGKIQAVVVSVQR
jgi:SAM-dependent methyltransferase